MVRILGLFILLFVFTSEPAFTQQVSCDTAVVDGANVFGNRMSEVNSAANTLSAKGATVRVRTTQFYDKRRFGDLDRYAQDILRQCPSWQGSGGSLKNNLVVMIVAINDRETYLNNGSSFVRNDAGLTTIAKRNIETQLMNPRFVNGDYAGGVVAGLSEIGKIVTALNQAPVSGSGITQTTVTNQPADLTGLWLVLGILAVVGGAVCIYFFVIKPRNQKQEDKQSAQRSAMIAKASAVSEVNSLPDLLSETATRVNFVLLTKTDSNTTAFLKNNLTDAERLIDEATQLNGNLLNSVSDPEDDRLALGDYRIIEGSFQAVLGKTQAARDHLNILRRRCDQIESGIQTQDVHEAEPVARKAKVPHPQAASEPKRTLAPEPVHLDHSKYSSKDEDVRRAIDLADLELGRAERYILSYDPWVSLEPRQLLWDARNDRDAALLSGSRMASIKLAHSARNKAMRARARAESDILRGDDYRRADWYRDYTWDPWYRENYGIVVVPLPSTPYQEPYTSYGYGYTIRPPSYEDPGSRSSPVPATAGASTSWDQPAKSQVDEGISTRWETSQKDEGVATNWDSNPQQDPTPSYEAPSYSEPERSVPSYESPSYDSGGSSSSWDSGSSGSSYASSPSYDSGSSDSGGSSSSSD